MTEPSAVVVGGGLAGVTAALRLADAGCSVTLVERDPRLGGRAHSFRRGSLWVDNGQHVFLRCCIAYRRLLQRLGASRSVQLQPRLNIPVLGLRDRGTGAEDSSVRLGRLYRSRLPGPIHLGPALVRYPHLSAVDKLRVARAAVALRTLDPRDPALDRRSFGSWLRAKGQSPRAVAALWDLLGMATLNAPADEVSLAAAVMVLRTSLLGDPGAADLGWATVPLGAIHHDAANAALAAAGVQVLLGTRADRIQPGHGGRAHEVVVGARDLPDGCSSLPGDVVVLAVPHQAAATLLPPTQSDHPDRVRQLRDAPILNLHVRYDRSVMTTPVLAVLGSPVQWLFDRSAPAGVADGGQYLVLSQSAARDEIDLPTAELRRRYLPELRRLLPAARSAQVTDFFVTRERAATFAPDPGAARLRPGARTGTPGLYLAGAWTATGWPETMEGAVRSGHLAADEALATRPADRTRGWHRVG